MPIFKTVFFFFLFIFCGCSRFLYYPDSLGWGSPSRHHFTPEEFQVSTSDGIQLESWWIPATTQPVKGTIVHCHGNAQNVTAHFTQVLWLKEEGYNILTFDYRGYGLSNGKPSPEGTVIDTLSELQEARKRSAHLPIIGIGQSLGGAILLRAAYDAPIESRPNKLILDSSFMSYQKAGKSILKKHWFTWPFQWISQFLLSDSFTASQDSFEGKSIPTLVIHTQNDPVISFELGKDLFDHLPDPKTFYEVPTEISDGKHIASLFRKPVQTVVLSFLDQK